MTNSQKSFPVLLATIIQREILAPVKLVGVCVTSVEPQFHQGALENWEQLQHDLASQTGAKDDQL